MTDLTTMMNIRRYVWCICVRRKAQSKTGVNYLSEENKAEWKAFSDSLK